MKAKELFDLLGGTNEEADVLINLHGKLYEITPSVLFGGKDDSLSSAVRVDLHPVSPPALRKYEIESE